MKRFASFLLAILTLTTVGAGCFEKREEYVPAPEPETIDIAPNAEGGEAARGGYDVTLTPALKTEKLIAALPAKDANPSFKGDQPVETLNPVPLPDGTKSEFPSVERRYNSTGEATSDTIVNVSLADTRGLPVLTAFLNSLQEYETEDGYRKSTDINGNGAWITYIHDPAGNGSGFGSLTMLYRDRFLIQIDGNLGTSEEDLLIFARAFDFDELN